MLEVSSISEHLVGDVEDLAASRERPAGAARTAARASASPSLSSLLPLQSSAPVRARRPPPAPALDPAPQLLMQVPADAAADCTPLALRVHAAPRAEYTPRAWPRAARPALTDMLALAGRGPESAPAPPPAPLIGVRVRPGEACADAGTAGRRGEVRSGWRDAVRAH